jgi:hypothetical protein
VHLAVDHQEHRSAAEDHFQCADHAGEVHRNPSRWGTISLPSLTVGFRSGGLDKTTYRIGIDQPGPLDPL